MNASISIDGSTGEGGGQVLRSSLALSLITGRSFEIHNIRAHRRKPGLLRQHLAAVRAAAEVGQARVHGDALSSSWLSFEPQGIEPGHHRFAIGSAGSTTLVLQTILWPLLITEGTSTVVLEGGTHNPLAPTADYLTRSLLPRLHALGASVDVRLHRAGFFPAGGGRLEATIHGGQALVATNWCDHEEVYRRRATVLIANLPISIANRELSVVREELGWPRQCLSYETVESDGPGNVLQLEAETAGGTYVVTSFGQRGVRAEAVARSAARAFRAFEQSSAPIDEHLADQLLIPFALAGGGSFRTVEPTMHTRTHAEILQQWLPVVVTIERDPSSATWLVSVRKR